MFLVWAVPYFLFSIYYFLNLVPTTSHMKKLLLLLLIGFQIAGFAQPITLATPESQGFSSERLKWIDREMTGWVDKGWMQGGAALVIRNNKIVY